MMFMMKNKDRLDSSQVKIYLAHLCSRNLRDCDKQKVDKMMRWFPLTIKIAINLSQLSSRSTILFSPHKKTLNRMVVCKQFESSPHYIASKNSRISNK